jgi:arylsulfatase A-like enzyme
MRRRLAALALLAAAGCRSPAPESAPAADGRASVLLLTIDTLRADHLGVYGYTRNTSRHVDALAREGTVFDYAYTYWPKTRGSFVAMLTGRRDSQTGYGKTHPALLDFNPTLASVLKHAGYATAAIVDNGNVAAAHGYHKGFDAYRETWQEAALATEMDRTRAITEGGIRFLRDAPRDRPFLLWLHYVNPHAPYTPPAPYDTAFLDDEARSGPRLKVVPGFHGGIPKQWAVPGQDRLGYYVAQYDGEVAVADEQVGRVLDALRQAGRRERTVVVLTSDHGESLGEHGYYFDHGEDLFDPSLRVPLIVAAPGVPGGRRSQALASTLDLVPTILDAVKVSYPPDLAGRSLLGAMKGSEAGWERLFARNDRNLTGSFDRRYKVVATPGDKEARLALYDRVADPAESRDLARTQPDELRRQRRELDLFFERAEREWARTRALVGQAPAVAPMSREACENLRTLGYVDARCAPHGHEPQ